MISYTNFIYHLGEFNGSDLLEFQSCDLPERRKFSDSTSLYVDDAAFYFYLETLFQEIVSTFDMFENCHITKKQWHQIMVLDVPSIFDVDRTELELIQQTLTCIDRWVTENVPEDGSFLVLGI